MLCFHRMETYENAVFSGYHHTQLNCNYLLYQMKVLNSYYSKSLVGQVGGSFPVNCAENAAGSRRRPGR